MKKAILFLLVVALAIPVFQSCKKGDNDPLISLRSRKARLAGEWTLSEGNIWETWSDGSLHNYAFTESSRTLTISGDNPNTISYTEMITIKKDGTFNKEINSDGATSTIEGTWYFGPKSKLLDIKDKETVWFTKSAASSANNISTFSGCRALNVADVWLLDQLKDKEIIVLINGTVITNDLPFSFNGSLTYVKK
jgi:hypothetical protein